MLPTNEIPITARELRRRLKGIFPGVTGRRWEDVRPMLPAVLFPGGTRRYYLLSEVRAYLKSIWQRVEPCSPAVKPETPLHRRRARLSKTG